MNLKKCLLKAQAGKKVDMFPTIVKKNKYTGRTWQAQKSFIGNLFSLSCILLLLLSIIDCVDVFVLYFLT